MGLFLQQIGTLFWKNWLCRIRQPILCLSEILWPCALFLILAAIRSQEPPLFVENCYLEPRNLPSYGIFPFIHSLLCNTGSICKGNASSFESSNPSWNLEDITEIEDAILIDFQDLSKDILEATEKFASLHKIWTELFNSNSSSDFTGFSLARLNLAENFLLNVEKMQKQMYFWRAVALLWHNGSLMNSVFPEDTSQKNLQNLLRSIKALKLFPSFTNNQNVTMAQLISMQNWISNDIRKSAFSVWKELWDEFPFSNELKSVFGSYEKLHENYLNIASLLRMLFFQWTTYDNLQNVIVPEIEKHIHLLSVERNDAESALFYLSNILKQLESLEDIFATFAENFFPERLEHLNKMQFPLEQLHYWYWLKTFYQLSDIIRNHVIKLLNVEKAALKYLQIVSPVLKPGSVNQSEMNSIVTKVTQMSLRMNSSSCEDLAEFLKTTFKLQDAMFTKDIRLKLCSFYETFDVSAPLQNNSQINFDVRLLIREFLGWQEINNVIQEVIELSYNLSHMWDIQMAKTYLFKNASSLLRNILDDMEETIEKQSQWKIITEVINQLCYSNEGYSSGMGDTTSDCLASLCLMKKYSWSTFVDSFLECLENSKEFFQGAFFSWNPSFQEYHKEAYEDFEKTLYSFSKAFTYNCSDQIFNIENLLNQAFPASQYTISKNRDVLQMHLENTLRMFVHLKCLDDENHLANQSFINDLKDSLSAFIFKKQSSTWQTPIKKTETKKPELQNSFSRLHIYYEDFESLIHLLKTELTGFYITDHSRNYTSAKETILKEVIRNFQNKIQYEWIIFTINEYIKLLNISSTMLKIPDVFFTQSENKDDFLSEETFSSEESFTHSTGCYETIKYNLTKSIHSVFSNSIMRTVIDNILLYSNTTVENIEKDLEFFKFFSDSNSNTAASFIEYLQEGLENNKNLSEICQLLYKKIDLEDFILLHKIQNTVRDTVPKLSDNPQFLTELICMFSNTCTNKTFGLLFISLMESLNLINYQFKENVTSTDFDCTSFTLTTEQVLESLIHFTDVVTNLISENNCLCSPTSDHTQQQIKKLIFQMKQYFLDFTEKQLLINNTIFNDLRLRDTLQNSSRIMSDIQSLTNITEDTVNLILRLELSKLQHLLNVFTAAINENCTEDVLSVLLEYMTKEESLLIARELCDIPPEKLHQIIILLIQNINFRSFVYKISIPTEMKSVLHIFLNHISKLVTFFEKYKEVFLSKKILANIPAITSFLQVFGVQSEQPALAYLQTLASYICKEGTLFFSDTAMFVNKIQISDTMGLDTKKYGIPENSTPFCLKFYQDILQSSNGAIKWTFLKPLLHGKILYTPDVPETRQIIYRANHTFITLEKLRKFSDVWLTTSAVLKSSNQLLRDPTFQILLLNPFLQNYLESQLNLDVRHIAEKLEKYENNSVKILNNSVVQQINDFSKFLINISSCFCFNRFLPNNSSDVFEEKAKEMIQNNTFLAGIIFNFSSEMKHSQNHHSNNKLPPHVKYTIRTNALYSIKTDALKNPVWKSHPQRLPGSGIAYSHVFAPVQDMIDRAIISLHTGAHIYEPEIQVQAMPYPCHTQDLFLNHIGFFFPLIMMLTWIINIASMVQKRVYEKEIHLEEYLKIMGVQSESNFLAWLLENIGIVIISSFIIVLILNLSGILAHSNVVIIFLFLLEFGISVIMFSFLVSIFFNKASTAALCGSLLYIINFLPYITLLVLQKQFNFATQFLLYLLSTTAFGQGIFLITTFESKGTGIQWNNLCQPAIYSEAMPFLWISGMIFIDSIIYFVLGWYLGSIMSGPIGHKKPWNFLFTVTYWKQLVLAHSKQKQKEDISTSRQNVQKGCLHSALNETTVKPGLSFISVSKMYSNSKIAIKDFSLNFYENEITCILGTNGAGKTTLLSMLSSLTSPSSGNIFVNGRDMQKELTVVRMEMGVCPQYDVLFDYLTVREHLLLFGALKMPSWSKNNLSKEVERALQEVGLLNHQLKLTCLLSGGMKRRLSVATAFIGSARTIVLDEPTSGVDPYSRRYIWDVLLKHRKGSTIAFTTQNLDEAEFLSDKVAIIQQGKLRCYGSPSFLKEKYTQGRELTLTKKNAFKSITQVTVLVQECIPSAFLKETSNSELIFAIPGKVDTAMYKHLFVNLDKHLQDLHISGYGITDTTMEKLFLQLLEHDEHTVIPQKDVVLDIKRSNYQSDVIGDNKHIQFASKKKKKTMQGIHLYQMKALLIYRFQHTRRDWKGVLANLVLPIIFVTIAMGMFNLKPFTSNTRPLKLSLDLYSNEQTFFSTDFGDSSNFTDVIVKHFGSKNNSCIYSSMNLSCIHNANTNKNTGGCRYRSNQSCPPSDTGLPSLNHRKTCTLYNLSGFSVKELLTALVIKDSYGGWTFTNKVHLTSQNRIQAKVWYSQKGFHALPSYLNYLNNLILWKNLPAEADWKQYGITVYSKPYQGAMVDEDKILENVRQCGVALCITLGFSILTASVGSTVVKDQETGARYLQHGFYLVVASLCVCVIASFQLTAFTFRENLAASALLLILFGYATFPWMYLVSGILSNSDVAFITFISTNCIIGLCTSLLTFLPRLLAEISNTESLTQIHNILKWAFLVFPQYCLSHGLMELAFRQVKFDLTNGFGIDSYISPFQMDYLGWIFTAMAIQGSISFLLRLVLNEQSFQRLRDYSPLPYDSLEDMDVEMERRRVVGEMTSNDILLLYNVWKCYGNTKSKSTIAVKDICLGVQAGECFGLLGLNGSGKTTLFKMLINEINPSYGKVMIRTSEGKEISMKSAHNTDIVIGYCPQKDALDNLLTGWDHLYYYCRLRGISQKHIHKISSSLSERLDLDDHIDQLVGTYSRGTKRKLSTAIALIGDPQILLLDEPSSGMDPCSKRHLWEVIKKEVNDGCVSFLSSHSMEECEALCTRLAVMVNGHFKCIGSPQHIKNRFGHGVYVTMRLNQNGDCGLAVIKMLENHFQGICLKKFHQNVLEYSVPQQNRSLAELFQVLETMKTNLQIKSYSIAQTTLEQVVIQFSAQEENLTSQMQCSMDSLRQQLPA
ncbi:ATP-binding cassette sub-family A member 13 isoform X2 [Hyperolius riggenbachi]|uniref:ATP-binding cassette sub-family A member 13 isoform X2 n=1 Tax=Hyperolius riggenbachi TaxID=752182 RepID=UPI0035A3C95A